MFKNFLKFFLTSFNQIGLKRAVEQNVEKQTHASFDFVEKTTNK